MDESRVELWQRAQEVLLEALTLPDRQRDGFVEDACYGDDRLLREVRSLLQAGREASGFFHGLADKLADAAEATDGSGSLEGRIISHYEVGAPIGRGGMGKVYRALDRRLGREVAIKVLPEELAGDPGHVARFRREARIVASLDHPNIGRIHEVEEVDDDLFLVLELVEGPTLRERLAAGPLPTREALEIARQIAEALEAAHELGIVHRDLKPANVKVDPEGRVRVLDFGIAKLPGPQRNQGSWPDVSPSTPLDVTRPGTVLGTAAYMSPEQARGKPIDRRSDVWAFGAVLYELLAGQRAFQGEDPTQVVARILESSPDWKALSPETPPAVRRLLERCLERNVRRRIQAIGEARIVLEDALLSDGTSTGAIPPRRARPGFTAAAALVGLVVGALASSLFGTPDEGAPPSRTLRLAVAEDASLPILAPTGDRVAFVSDGPAWVVFFDGSQPRRLDGTEGGIAFFWSPDGEHLGFMLEGAIRRIPAGGGRSSVVGTIGDRFSDAAWLDDGTIVAALGPRIVTYPELGGEPRDVWRPQVEGRSVRGLEAGPDGSVLLILDGRTIGLLRNGEMREVYTTERGTLSSVAYAPPGHIVFQRSLDDVGIWALPITRRAEPAGPPLLVAAVNQRPSASGNGHLAYLDDRTSRQRRNLIWVDRTGETVGVIGQPQARLEQFDLSPSGRRIVAVAEEEGRRRIWIHDLQTDERFELSPMPDPGQRWPRWSMEEEAIAFRFDKDGEQWIGTKPLEPGTAPVHLTRGVYPSFAQDGRVLFNFAGDIFLVDPAATAEPELFLGTPGGESEARPSALGLVAFLLNTPTGVEVFLTRYDRPGERWQVSTNGGMRPKWRSDGRELYYLSDGALMAVPVEYDGGTPRIGRPTRLFTLANTGVWGLEYDPAPDGQRFLMLRALPRESITDVNAIVLVQNWVAGFDR